MPRTKFVVDPDEEISEEIKEDTPKKTKKTFDQSDGITCRSVVQGALFVEGIKTGMMYTWTDYGDETEVEYRDLVAAVRSKDKTVYEPRFIVENEDFIAEFPVLEKYYANQFTTRDIKEILNMSENDMVKAIEKLPKGAIESLKSIAAQQIASGRLDSVRKIKALDQIFGTDLNLISELSQSK